MDNQPAFQNKFYHGTRCYMFTVFALIIIQFAAGILWASIAISRGNPDAQPGEAFNVISMFLLQFAILMCLYFYTRKYRVYYGLSLKIPKSNGKIRPLFFIAPVLAALVCLIGFYLPAEWFLRLIALTKIDMNQFSFEINSPAAIVFFVIVTVFVAPVLEELLFRGILLEGLKSKFSASLAVVLSAAAFALMHMNIIQFVYQFFLGLFCAYLVLKAKSVIPAILTHMFSNIFVLSIEFTPLLDIIVNAVNYLAANPVIAVIITVVLMAGAAFAFYWIARLLGGKNEIEVQNEQQTGKITGLALGLGACAFMLIGSFILLLVA